MYPAGNELTRKRRVIDSGLDLDVYVNKEPRKVKRWIHEGLTDNMLAELKTNPEAMLQRKQTV